MQYDIPLINKNFTDLNPLICGRQACPSEHSFGPFIRRFYLLHYVIKGKGLFRNDNGTYNVDADDIFIIRPGEITTYIADKNDPWEYIWIGFGGELAAHVDLIKQDVIHKPYAKRIFMEMLESGYFDEVKEEYLVSKLFMLYAVLFEGESNKQNRYVAQIDDFMQSNYMLNIKVEDLAKMVNINRNYVGKLFKKEKNMTIQQRLISIRMERAMQLLKTKDHNVGTVAGMVGYEDRFVFSKMFKKTYGVSPKFVNNK